MSGVSTDTPPLIPTFQPSSKYFNKVRAIGLQVRDYQNAICVNQVGLRFYDETKGGFGNANAMGQATQITCRTIGAPRPI